ncbi:MAG: hypothetical protein IPM26_01195 [Saprospiraceae bacterium]|jgi:hypothetical protein|nr:hypothetical protein [Saprospiraceae bacterium]
MTLGQFFESVSAQPSGLLTFFVMVPVTALIAGILGKGEGHLSPWKYLYSVLIYLACIPGIFALTLSVYLFLFERTSILDTNVFTQILPVICMIATLWLVRKNVDLKFVPGFGRLNGLMFMLTALITLMWILEKTHIWVISFMPFYQFLLFFLIMLILVRLGWSRMFS